MKGYKLPFNDKFGNALHEGDKFKYTKHNGLSLPTFEGRIVWIEDFAAFGYQRNTPLLGHKVQSPFATFIHPKRDFFTHIERIEPNNNLI